MKNIFQSIWLFKKEIFPTLRIHTMLYALILTFIGYQFTGDTNWTVAILNSILFSFITSSIITYNDLIDRESDFIRGKTFTHNQPKVVFALWLMIPLVGIIIFSTLTLFSVKLTLFCLVIWLLGISYSYLQKMYIFQNILVALCTASPILCASIYQAKLDTDAILVFTSLALIIFSREVLGDVKHKNSDIGYKTSIPIKTEKKYPSSVSYLSLSKASVLLPKSIKKEIDIYLKGECLESHKIICSILSYAPFFLIPVLGWQAIILAFIFALAMVSTFMWLLVDSQELEIWTSRASLFYNIGISTLLLCLVLK